jgi:hypothetical protein
MQKRGRLGRGEVTLSLATWCRFFANGSLIPIVIDQSFHETKDFSVNSVIRRLHRAELYRSRVDAMELSRIDKSGRRKLVKTAPEI